jgi:23S rRNA pseudouridine1911/1915/1917 synthase
LTDRKILQVERSETINLRAGTDDAGKRLDAFLAEKIDGWSRSRLQRVVDDGDVLVNEKEAKPSYKLRDGDEIEIELAELPATRFEPENIPLDIVFEDEYLAVINKPAGMIVHPGAGVNSGTLANAIAYHFSLKDSKFENRVGIVHRLDKDTSGLIVVAKNDQVHEQLSAQFGSRKVKKTYVALVHGVTRETHGKIDRPIARERFHRTRMTVAANGREALTLWKVRHRFEKFTLLDVEIKTGRTHQIRVHLASINHPIVADPTYNAGRDNTVADQQMRKAIQKLDRPFLHSEKLAFTHPVGGEHLYFTAEMPRELKEFLDLLWS